MKGYKKIGRSLSCLLLAATLFSSGTAKATKGDAVSVFVATDRHAELETRTLTSDDAETQVASASKSQTRKKGKRNGQDRKKSGKSLTVEIVLDENGRPIWHDQLDAVLTMVAEDEEAVQPEIVFLGGDYVGQDGTDQAGNSLKTPVFSLADLDAEILAALDGEVETYYTYGSHDLNAEEAYADCFLTGPAAGDGYYLYGISYGQMIYATDAQAARYTGKDAENLLGGSAETAAQSFLDWVNSLEDHWPILVMTHVPLHAHRGDNLGAEIWADALNQAAESHEILVMWGHNHTIEKDASSQAAEEAVYWLAPGSALEIQTAEKKETAAKSIRFAYMNAGYLTNGVGTLLTFEEEDDWPGWDSVTVKRYRLQGKETSWIWPLRSWPADCT